jgi:hypothetical protein
VKNWFRSKCEEYGLATLTSKAEDAVVMLALQKVDCVTQLALSDSVPEGLSEVQLADFIVLQVAPSAPAPAPTLAQEASSAAPPDSSSSPPPPASLHDVASLDEFNKLEKEVKLLKKKLEKLTPPDKDNDPIGSGGGLVLDSIKGPENAETVIAAMRSVQQLVIRMEHQVQDLTAHVISQPVSDPVLNSHISKLTNHAIPVMKHHSMFGWQEHFLAVRGRWLCYDRSYPTAVQLAESLPHHNASDPRIIDLVDCSACEEPQACDYDRCAFKLTSSCGQSLLLSHRETACVVAIIETINRCSAPLAAAASAPSGLKQSRDEEQRGQLFGKSGEDMR